MKKQETQMNKNSQTQTITWELPEESGVGVEKDIGGQIYDGRRRFDFG